MTKEQLEQLYKKHIERLSNHYSKLIDKIDIEGVIIHSGYSKSYYDDDHHVNFKPYGNFKHWIPYNKPDGFIVIKSGFKPVFCYRSFNDFWYKPVGEINGFWANSFDIRIIENKSELSSIISNIKNYAYLGEEVQFAESLGISEENINNRFLVNNINYFRRLKDDYEIYCTEEATRIANIGHIVAENYFLDGESEFTIHLEYLRATNMNENKTPYPNIIALNENSSYLHYGSKNISKPEKHLSFLIDAGAKYLGYASDISRTYAKEKSGVFYDLILEMDKLQLSLIDMIKPDLSYVDLHDTCHKMIGEVMHKFGIVNLSSDEIYEKGITQYFLPHGLGHLLGVQVHDVGGHQINSKGELLPPPDHYPFLRLTQTIEAGHLFTIEPGIYFIDMLLDKLMADIPDIGSKLNTTLINELKTYGGIRIEDNIYVKNDSNYNITRTIFG